MTVLMHTAFGSHLYGTSTPLSDFDYKSVVIPSAHEILLQRVRGVTSNARPKEHGEKNEVGEVDLETFALQRYLELLAEGQTVALDILFAPRKMMLEEPHPLWLEIFDNRHRLVSRKAGSFVGYCRTQSNRYGIRGSRVHAVREIVEWLDQAIETHAHLGKLGDADAASPLADFIAQGKLLHTALIDIEQPNQGRTVRHLECCNRKIPFFATLKSAREVYARVLNEYGTRAKMAEKNEGIDWKALSHAVRVGREALEFLATGRITFPLPYASHILAIKSGMVPYAEVATEIEGLLEDVEAAQATSILPDVPDHAFMDDLVLRAYGEKIAASTRLTPSAAGSEPLS